MTQRIIGKAENTNSARNVDPSLLPRDAATGAPLAPRREPGYYPGFRTLSQSAFWDDATRRVVTNRVDSQPLRQFFSAEEWEFWTVVFGHLIPQTDRTPDRQIPIVALLDHRLLINQAAGYRFENMPQDRDAYRLGREAIDQEAQHRYGIDFLFLPHRQQDLLLKAIHDGESQAAPEIWQAMSVHRFWQLIMGDAIAAYYAHPWAWDEIGFGGPAYPRAYTRLERGEPEPWEVEEKRYEWIDPEASVSGGVESAEHFHTESDQHAASKTKGNLR
jgi:hypothetical protein